MLISVIIPTLNEEKSLANTIQSLQAEKASQPLELIITDGGSTDSTKALAQSYGSLVITTPRGRGLQMNEAAKLASGDILLFLHADTILPPGALKEVRELIANPNVRGGFFRVSYSGNTKQARLLTYLPPFLKIFGMCYGDRGLFVRKSVFTMLDGYKPIPLFEDYELCARLRKLGGFVETTTVSTTSSRRFDKQLLRTLGLWLLLQTLYWIGVPPRQLDKFYRVAR